MNIEGDPKLYDTGDGADLLIQDGQPDMDEGLENAVYLSLFTPSLWWGNAVAAEAERYASRLEEIQRRTLTNQTRLDAEQYARDALAWMVPEGVAKRVTVAATIPAVGFLGLTVTIEQPDRTSTVRYQISWTTMAVRVGAAE